jgi:hypothetical protein
MVMTCKLASVPSTMPKSAGRFHLGMQMVPLPVSFRSIGFSEILNVLVFEPNPRLKAT